MSIFLKKYFWILVAVFSGQSTFAVVIPDYYETPGLSRFRDYQNANLNEYIDPFSGKLNHNYVDLFLPGSGGLDISIERTYNVPGEFLGSRTATGIGWTIHFGRIVKNDTTLCQTILANVTDNPVIETPDGRRHLLYWAAGVTANALYVSQDRWSANCIVSGNGGLLVRSPDGVEYTMNQPGASLGEFSWYTTQIKDRNGNTINISYRNVFGNILINQITSSDGRTVSFTYLDESSDKVRLFQISANGQVWTYNYTLLANTVNHYLLTEVVRPGGTRWLYSYNPPPVGVVGYSAMNQATYPEGGTIRYTYQFVAFNPSTPTARTTVVSSKTTGGANVRIPGTWSYSYVPGAGSDTTTVTAPNGRFVYRHFGYGAAVSGTVWRIGTLIDKNIYNGSASTPTHTEAYTWSSQLLSNEGYYLPSAFGNGAKADVRSNVPIMTQKIATRDGSSYTTTYSGHDDYGNPTSIAESGNDTKQTNLTYYIDTTKWIVNQVKDETVVGVGAITRQFNGNGMLTQENKYGVVSNFGYFGTGDLSAMTNARGLTSSFSNYYRGVAQSELHPENVTRTRAVNATGTVQSETDGRSFTRTFAYDGLNRLTAQNFPINSAVSIAWGAFTKNLTRGDYRENATYDGLGMPTQIQRTDAGTGAVITKTMQYNAVGQKTFESYPNSSSGTTYTYDILGRVLSMTHPDGTSKVISFLNLNRVSGRDERLFTTTYTFRSYGNPDQKSLVGINAPEGVTTNIARNKLDQITSVTQGGRTRTYAYDSRYFMTSSTNPETGTTTFGRDAVGNMVSRQVGSSPITSYTYDGLNRLQVTNYSSTDAADVTYGYDANSNMTSIATPEAQATYGYDANNNLLSETQSVNGRTFSLGYTWNNLDLMSTITYPGNRIVSYAPDAFGRPKTASPYVTAVSYHPNNAPASMTYANGVTTTTSLNSRLWPSRIYASGASGLVDLNYGYDGTGNVASINEAFGAESRSLGYDGIGRLTTANGSWGSGSYSYDATGNLSSQTLGGFNLGYTYDANNRLASTAGSKAYTFTYDNYGNVTGNGKDAFKYNEASNLACINCAGAVPVNQTYNGQNIRVLKQVAGKDTYFVYTKGGDLLWEYTPADGTLKENVYLSGKLVVQRAVANLR